MKIFKCEVCGSELSGKEAVFADEEILCERCAMLYHACQTCVNIKKCNFRDIKDNIPETVQKRFQDPLTGSIHIIEMQNIDRVKKHCSNCICSFKTDDNEIPFCLRRETGVCDNYKFGV